MKIVVVGGSTESSHPNLLETPKHASIFLCGVRSLCKQAFFFPPLLSWTALLGFLERGGEAVWEVRVLERNIPFGKLPILGAKTDAKTGILLATPTNQLEAEEFTFLRMNSDAAKYTPQSMMSIHITQW